MIIAVANQKGGVGKTTTVANLAIAMAQSGHRVLAVDLDPQASLTFYLGYDETELEAARATLYYVITGQCPLDQMVQAGPPALVPASITLAKAETELVSEPNGGMVLKEILAGVAESYDVVLLDCPPSLGMLTVNALNAATRVLIPVKTQVLSLIGLTQIVETIRKVRRRANPTLEIAGILPTMHHTRYAHDADVVKGIEDHYGEMRIFESVPNATRLARAAGNEGGTMTLGHPAYGRIATALLATP